MGRVVRRQFVLVVLTLAVARAAPAQTGSISGTVTGPPSTTVNVYTATAQLADATFVATTDVDFSTHEYHAVPGLTPGTYFVRTAGPPPPAPRGPVVSGDSRGIERRPGARGDGDRGGHDERHRLRADPDLRQYQRGANARYAAVLRIGERALHPNLQRRRARGPGGLSVPTPGASVGGPLDTDPHAGGTWTWTVGGLRADALRQDLQRGRVSGEQRTHRR